MIIDRIITLIKDAENIAIMPHISVDGDGLGSSLALGLTLKKMGKKVTVYLEEDVPYIYDFLPGKELVSIVNDICKYKNTDGYDLAIALDTGDMKRLGDRADIFERAKITVNIDHHATNTEFAFINYVQPGSAAVGEIVYQMIKVMGQSLDAETATCLYVAITTDTGGFRFSNTTSATHQITADLINNGVNVAEISQKVFETASLEKTKLMGEAVSSLELHENGKIALIILTDEMMKKAGASEEDCDGIVNLGRNIKGVEVAVMMRQKANGAIKVNFRSKSYVDVAAIAGLFKGGGHKRAAGCIIEGKSTDEAKKMLIEDIKGTF
ncbi:MAG: bifunctional oligoribonuclease/PAP phosphatase NrnA [Clostridia bacterium]|nr:bifunctional oligoribonuclease/PAP phosphatase NrnA [Clostridia bacterium]